MTNARTWLHHPLIRLAQHLAFWVLSFIVFLHLFKTGTKAEKIDYIFTVLFHITIIPAVYLNLRWLLPRLANYRQWPVYVISAVALMLLAWSTISPAGETLFNLIKLRIMTDLLRMDSKLFRLKTPSNPTI